MYLPGSDFPDTVHGCVKLGSYIRRHLTDFIVTWIQVACHHVTQTLVWAAGYAEESRQALPCYISRVEWGQSVPANLRGHEVVDGPFELGNWKSYVSLSWSSWNSSFGLTSLPKSTYCRARCSTQSFSRCQKTAISDPGYFENPFERDMAWSLSSTTWNRNQKESGI